MNTVNKNCRQLHLKWVRLRVHCTQQSWCVDNGDDFSSLYTDPTKENSNSPVVVSTDSERSNHTVKLCTHHITQKYACVRAVDLPTTGFALNCQNQWWHTKLHAVCTRMRLTLTHGSNFIIRWAVMVLLLTRKFLIVKTSKQSDSKLHG